MTHITLSYKKNVTSRHKTRTKNKKQKNNTVKFQLISATSDDFQIILQVVHPPAVFSLKNTVITYPKDICHFLNTRENIDWSFMAWPRGILGSHERFFKQLINWYGI